MAAYIQYGPVFGLACDDVASFPLVMVVNSFQGHINGFRSSGGKGDLLLVGADQCSHLRADGFNSCGCQPAGTLADGGGIAEMCREIAHHNAPYTRIKGSSGLVVQINKG